MSRLIYVPALPIKMRYQEWYYRMFPRELFNKYFDDIKILGDFQVPHKTTKDSFSDIEHSSRFEAEQIISLFQLDIKDDDTLLLGDLSFPGIFSNVLFHKPIKNAYAICHGTSKNAYDIFSSTRKQKWEIEKAQSKLFKKIFVGSEYHKKKLGWENTIVTRLPYPPKIYIPRRRRVHEVISVTRQGLQKVNKRLEKGVENEFNLSIKRKTFAEWQDYYRYIASSKVLLSTAKEETFGYQIIDAIMGGAIPIAPNKFSYPELLPDRYLYNNEEELYSILDRALTNHLKPPKSPLCHQQMKDFFDVIGNIMKTGVGQ